MTETVAIDKLTPDQRNANQGTKRGLDLLDNSLRQNGAGRSVLLDKHNRIIAGNKTVERAADIGIDDVIVVDSDGSKLVAVRRTDLDLETDERARAMAYADNRVGQVDLTWDPSQIAADLEAGLDLSSMFYPEELSAILEAAADELLGTDAEPPEAQVDRAAELQAEWKTELGQLWEMPSRTVKGKAHRLLCGDSTNAEDVARLMNGERARLLATDPPYNVGKDYGSGVNDAKTSADYEAFTRAWFGLWQARSDKQIVTPGCYNLACWLRWFDAFYVAPWTKTNAMTHGFVSRFFCWEPIVFFGGTWFEGNEKVWPRIRANDVFAYNVSAQTMPSGESLTPLHPCPKPVPMWQDLMESYTEAGALIADAFGGSGTTIVAAEQTKRLGYCMELDAKSCAVTLQRLADMGLEPRLLA